ncbi:MAG: hypothetical protein OEN20_05250, partial [Gammaproteobacteria bacterium]|nr:hypothetical protein [Gammaproteobacteria bacterium]
ARGSLTDQEREILAREVFCEHVPDMDEYRAELNRAGFEDLELIDMSEPWSVFVQERWSGFRALRERNLQLHGAQIVDGLDAFYSAVVELFTNGNLGGIRFVARKPV